MGTVLRLLPHMHKAHQQSYLQDRSKTGIITSPPSHSIQPNQHAQHSLVMSGSFAVALLLRMALLCCRTPSVPFTL